MKGEAEVVEIDPAEEVPPGDEGAPAGTPAAEQAAAPASAIEHICDARGGRSSPDTPGGAAVRGTLAGHPQGRAAS